MIVSGDLTGLEGATGATAQPLLLPALGSTVWTVLPFVATGDAQEFSLASRCVHGLLLPARNRAALQNKLMKELAYLPFDFRIELRALAPEFLQETLGVLRPVRPMRRREQVARDAGWAPTEADPWRFQRLHELIDVITAGRIVASVRKHQLAPSLLLGATLRVERCEGRALEGPLLTAPLALEWVDGPAADPLQLCLRLVLGQDEQVRIDLEIISGGWSEWAEKWTISDGTLHVDCSLAVPLPDSKHLLLVRQELGSTSAIVNCHTMSGLAISNITASPVVTTPVALLERALAGSGEDGIHAIACISELSWPQGASPIAWCPPEISRLIVRR